MTERLTPLNVIYRSMKSVFTSLTFLAIAASSQAHQSLPDIRDGKKVDPAVARQIASPNRTSSQTWANNHRRFKNDHPNKNRVERAAAVQPGPVLWVDANGKTLGRALAETSVLVPYEDQTAVLDGLSSDRVCDVKGTCTFPGGMNWSDYFAVYYPSRDCTGPAYSTVATAATPYKGIPVKDNGETFIYMARGADNVSIETKSYFTDGTCYAYTQPYPVYAAPVTAVLPASTFGTGPYYIK